MSAIQNILAVISKQIVFWAAWVVIPLIMEIIPSIIGFFVLVKKRKAHKKDRELVYWPEITLIVPNYNSGDTLEKCLDSVFQSEYPADKITVLVVNNGSTDNSFEVFRQYQWEHNRYHLKWMNAKQGKSHALNMALFHSTGKYIIQIDSDGILHPSALKNMVTRFENHGDIDCMTGVILTNPEQIERTGGFWKRLMQRTEFFEYAQAFLAGRNFQSQLDSIFTMAGAFSAFRKSIILKTRLYNAETVGEDTHITFQIRRLLKGRIDICENALFFVDPIPDFGSLYIQRQRWQRGEIEVVHMFDKTIGSISQFVTNFMTRLLMYDHTFAFPRMIWYFALPCLVFINYPINYVVISVLYIYLLYVLTTFLYYLCICTYLYFDKKIKRYYMRKAYLIFVLPIYSLVIFWVRLAGIINSAKHQSSWKARTLRQEEGDLRAVIGSDLRVFNRWLNRLKGLVNNGQEQGDT
ncbi:MAG TPA: TIGR03111 family XrtG-associated glycosyltransferase [Caproiciproducens sp.]|nr:TIGR03111 family XrtG-associated glycosyltransferase [Caproiciproducens sp.]